MRFMDFKASFFVFIIRLRYVESTLKRDLKQDMRRIGQS